FLALTMTGVTSAKVCRNAQTISPKRKKRPESRFSVTLSDIGRSAARTVENGDGAAVLRPARVGVADCDRTFVAVGDGAHTVGRHAARSEEVAGGGCTALAESEVVFTRTAFVGMAFDRDRVLRITLQPLGLLGKRL